MTTSRVTGRRMRYPELETRYELQETLGSGEERVNYLTLSVERVKY